MPKQTASASGAPPHEAPEGDTAAAAEAAAEHSDAAAAAAEPAAAGKQQQQGKSRKVRFQKNDPNTFTFKLLPVSQQQLREQAAAAAAHQRPRMQLQRVIPPNARNKPQQPLPEYLQQQLEKLDIGEEETGKRAGPRVEQDLSGDCYFPQDGYDYSQHLVSLGGGAFLAHEGGKETIEREEKEAETMMRRDKEASQVLAAMEASEAYEDIADDFVASALTDADGKQWAPDEKELLWGSRPPLLPPAIGDLLFKHIEEGDSAELEEGDSAEIEEGDSSDWGSEETEDRRGDTPQRERHPNNSALSQRLEQLLEEYREECIGELDPEEAEESDSFSAYEECFDDFLKSQERTPGLEGVSSRGRRGSCCSDSSSGSSTSSSSSRSSNLRRKDEGFRLCEMDEDLRNKTLALARMQEEEEENEATVHAAPMLPARARPTWDGETIMSARSGVSVQPRAILIGSSRASKMSLTPFLATHAGAPLGAKGPLEGRRAQLPPSGDAEETAVELPEVSTYRPRGETPEQRKARKAAVKEAQRILRANKKANKQLLKEETKKSQAAQARISPFDVRPGVRYFKL